MTRRKTRPRKPRSNAKRAVEAVTSSVPDEGRACGTEQQARRLLEGIADALNACERAGIKVKLAHGAVITAMGYVLPLADEPPRFKARTRLLTEFSGHEGPCRSLECDH